MSIKKSIARDATAVAGFLDLQILLGLSPLVIFCDPFFLGSRAPKLRGTRGSHNFAGLDQVVFVPNPDGLSNQTGLSITAWLKDVETMDLSLYHLVTTGRAQAV